MNYILKNAKFFMQGKFQGADIFVKDGSFFDISENIIDSNATVIDCKDMIIFPGFIDVHVHLREPGFFYKETIASGTMSAAHGGYTYVCSMPNLNPVPDTYENLKVQLDIIEKDANVRVKPYASITKGENGKELSDMDELAPYVCAFSDDGRGVQSEEMMISAMKKAKELGKIIVAHCEDNSLLFGGYIHDGQYAKAHGHKGICSESEYGPIARDIELIRKTGCAYHVCHISTKESVDLIRQAKADGLDITCETSPTYLLLNDSMLQEDGRFKMNPPIRSEEDRLALIEGLKDGTIDMIATDHAPHSAEEKSKGLKGSAMGVVGLECAFPLLYTYLVKTGILPFERLVQLFHCEPKRRFSLEGGIRVGKKADLTIWDMNKKTTVNPETFLTKGRSTPFSGTEIYGECVMTMVDGKIVWQKN